MRFARLMTVMTTMALVTGQAAPVTAATPRPKITFKMAASATAVTGRFTYSYTDASMPTGGKLALQRFIGSPKRWTTVRIVHGKSGHGAVRASTIGVYSFRLAVFDKHGKALVAVRRTGKAYADLPLAQICSAANVYQDHFWQLCQPNAGSDLVGTTQFAWVLDTFAFENDPGETGFPGTAHFSVSKTTCRSLHLVMGVSNEDFARVGGPATATVGVYEFSSDGGVGHKDAIATFAAGVLTTVDAKLRVGHDYGFNAVSASQPAVGGFDLLMNGTMSCYTKTGA